MIEGTHNPPSVEDPRLPEERGYQDLYIWDAAVRIGQFSANSVMLPERVTP